MVGSSVSVVLSTFWDLFHTCLRQAVLCNVNPKKGQLFLIGANRDVLS